MATSLALLQSAGGLSGWRTVYNLVFAVGLAIKLVVIMLLQYESMGVALSSMDQ
jgi:hypothetical protein